MQYTENQPKDYKMQYTENQPKDYNMQFNENQPKDYKMQFTENQPKDYKIQFTEIQPKDCNMQYTENQLKDCIFKGIGNQPKGNQHNEYKIQDYESPTIVSKRHGGRGREEGGGGDEDEDGGEELISSRVDKHSKLSETKNFRSNKIKNNFKKVERKFQDKNKDEIESSDADISPNLRKIRKWKIQQTR